MSETRATIRARAALVVGTAINTTLNNAIRDAHREAMRKHDWRFMEASTTISVAAGATTFSLPADFKSEMNPEMSDSDGLSYRRMQKVLKNGIEARRTDETGRPLLYRIWNGVGYLYEKADDDYTFSLEYYAWLPALSEDSGGSIYTANNSAFIDEIVDFLEYRAVAAGFRRLRNTNEANYYDALADEKLLELISDDMEIGLANFDFQMQMPG